MNGPAPRGLDDRPLIAIGMMLIAYLLFSFIDTGSKWLGALGIPALQLSFMRYVGHFVISSALLTKSGVRWSNFKCEEPFLVVIRALMLMLSTIFNFIAIRYLPLTLTSTILFSAPIIICALSWPLLREPVGIFRWSAIAVGFGGIVIAIRPFDESFHWAVFLSLSGAFCFALYSILTRKLSDKVTADTLQFYAGAIGTFVLLPFAIYEWQSPTQLFHWAVMISLGFFGWAGHQIMTNAMRLAPANLLMPFGYSFMLYLAIWSYFVFDHVPDRWTVIGAAIIVAAGLFIWFRERRLYRERIATKI